MTILAILQRVAPKLAIAVPTAVFGSDVRENVELADVANGVAEMIGRAHDWQTLKRQWAVTGNGETLDFDLPDDYDRMPKDQKFYPSDGFAPLTGPVDHDEWLANKARDFSPSRPEWTILGGQFAFWPAIASGDVAQTYYMSNEYALDTDDVRKAAFTADTDTFRLDDTLLRLGVIWRWKAAKGLPAQLEEAEFSATLMQRIERDRGSRILRVGGMRTMRGVRTAYPQAIVVS